MKDLLKNLRSQPRGALFCRMLFVLVCAIWVVRGRPPMLGQTAPSNDSPLIYGLEVKSAVQDSRMDGFASTVAEMKASEQRQWTAMTDLRNAVSGMQGEERGLFGVLGLLQIGAFVFQRKASKRGGE